MLDALEHSVQAVDARPPRRVVARPALPAAALERVGLVCTGRVAAHALQRQPGVAIKHVWRDIRIAGRKDNEHVSRSVVELSGGQRQLLEDDARVSAVAHRLENNAVAAQIALVGLRQREQALRGVADQRDEALDAWLTQVDQVAIADQDVLTAATHFEVDVVGLGRDAGQRLEHAAADAGLTPLQLAVVDRELKCAVGLEDDEALRAAAAQIVGFVQTQVLELAGSQDRIYAVFIDRPGAGSQENLARGRHRIGKVDVTLIELVVQDNDPVERRRAQAAAFSDSCRDIFDIGTVITAVDLDLHLIAFLGGPSPAGLQAFWPPYSVNRSPNPNRKGQSKFFLHPPASGQVSAEEEVRAARIAARLGLGGELPGLHRLKEGLQLFAPGLQLARRDFHRLDGFAGQVGNLDLRMRPTGLDDSKLETVYSMSSRAFERCLPVLTRRAVTRPPAP